MIIEWNYETSGGSLLNGTRAKPSDTNFIKNSLEKELDDLKANKNESESQYDYFIFKNLLIKKFPDLQLATFVDIWILITDIDSEQRMKELREL